MSNAECFATQKSGKNVTKQDIAQSIVGHLDCYDRDFFVRLQLLWYLGDWSSLKNLSFEILQQHPDRAKIALLIATAHLQLSDDFNTAKNFIHLAQNWGIDRKYMSQILLSSVYNSLGRGRALAGMQFKALEHFEKAVCISMLGACEKTLIQHRIDEQYKQLGLDVNKNVIANSSDLSVKSANKTTAFKTKILVVRELGKAWAGNTINTVIFRHHGILTRDNTQYTAFYVDKCTLRLVQLDLTTNIIKTHDIAGEYNLQDAHNSISLGMDRLGHLHISYDHHATQLRYRRSAKAHSIEEWSDEVPMTGVYEDRVTYPTFILPRYGYPLTLLYRDGVHNKGTARLKTYDEVSKIWVDHPQAILSGSEQRPWTSNAYWNHPAIGTDGSLHLTFVWRTNTLGEDQRINNINIGYACSHDNGVSWQTSLGRPYKLPITQVNVESVHLVSPGSNLINQTSMALDSHNRPHVVFYSDDANGILQYQHLWFDGKVWRHHFISERKTVFNLCGGGTLQIPISRPEIVIDRNDNVFVITRGDHSSNKMCALWLEPPNYDYIPKNIDFLSEEEIGFSEPIIDRSRWVRSNVLTVLMQYNYQPNHDLGDVATYKDIDLIDFDFSLEND